MKQKSNKHCKTWVLKNYVLKHKVCKEVGFAVVFGIYMALCILSMPLLHLPDASRLVQFLFPNCTLFPILCHIVSLKGETMKEFNTSFYATPFKNLQQLSNICDTEK